MLSGAVLTMTKRVCRAPIVRSMARVTGALVFSHHFLSEDPFFQELIQAINFGLAFVKEADVRVIGQLGV